MMNLLYFRVSTALNSLVFPEMLLKVMLDNFSMNVIHQKS